MLGVPLLSPLAPVVVDMPIVRGATTEHRSLGGGTDSFHVWILPALRIGRLKVCRSGFPERLF